MAAPAASTPNGDAGSASEHDVIVIGAGPGGSTAAALLAEQGVRVLVLDKDEFPRPKIGESLLPGLMPVLERLGIEPRDDTFVYKRGARFVCEDTEREQAFAFAGALPGAAKHAWHVDRARFDALLRDRARELGADVRHGETVTDAGSDAATAWVRTRTATHRARYLIDSSGQSRLLARRHDAVAPYDQFGACAVWAHFENAQTERLGPDFDIRIMLRKEGWGWIIPLPGRRLSIGIVARHKITREDLDNGLLSGPLCTELLHGSTRLQTAVTGNYSYRNTAPSGVPVRDLRRLVALPRPGVQLRRDARDARCGWPGRRARTGVARGSRGGARPARRASPRHGARVRDVRRPGRALLPHPLCGVVFPRGRPRRGTAPRRHERARRRRLAARQSVPRHAADRAPTPAPARRHQRVVASELDVTAVEPNKLPPLAVTGYSMLSCLGGDRAQHIEALRAGRSGLGPSPIPLEFETAVGSVDAELPELEAPLRAWQTRLARMAASLVAQLDEPLRRARERYRPERIAVLLGTSTAGAETTEAAYQRFVDEGQFPGSYDFRKQHTFGAVLHVVRAMSGAAGPSWMASTACTSSGKTFATAQRLLAADMIDAAIVGGLDTLCTMTLEGFHSLQALDRRRCRPFREDRMGINIGEGGAFALVERHGDARVVVEGIGETSDAYHISAPHPEGLGAQAAMREALQRAGCDAAAVEHVNAHGTGTTLNDTAEAHAIATVLGTEVPVVSTKAFTGHTLGAAAALEFAFSAIAIEEGFVPPALGESPIDPKIALRIPTEPLQGTFRRVLSNSFAFGGNNVSLLIAAP